MQRVDCRDAGPRRSQHAETLFMLNCYDVWSATVLGPCCLPDHAEREVERDGEGSRCH